MQGRQAWLPRRAGSGTADGSPGLARRPLRWWTGHRPALMLLVAAGLFGAGRLGLGLPFGHATVTAVSPLAGLALAAVLLGGDRMLVAVGAGTFGAAALSGHSVLLVLACAGATVLQTALGAWVLHRLRFRRSLERMRDVVTLLGASLGGTAAGMAIVALGLGLLGGLHGSALADAVRLRWLGDLASDMIAAPVVLVLFSRAARGRISLRSIAPVLALALASAIPLRYHEALAYLIFPMLLLVALLARQLGAVLGSLAVSAVTLYFTFHGYGPFAGAARDAALAQAQAFAMIGAVTALLVAAARTERSVVEAAVRRLADSERELAHAKDHFRSLFDNAPYALITVDDRGLITLANAAAERLFGYTRDVLVGRRADVLLPVPADAPPFWASGSAAGSTLELRGRRSDGSEFPVELSLSPMNASEGALLSVAISDVTDRKQATDALAHRASHDPLTGLPNRALFLDRLEHGLARARRSTHRLAIVFLDLDDFKIVNDTRGHDVGDLLLRTLAPRLSAALRPGDTIARFGGDEFVVLCEDLESDADALNIARRMAAACAEPVDLRGWRHSVSVSAGIAVLPPGRPLSAAELLRDADTAMYRAKASGKGRIELFDDGMRAHLDQQLEAEAALAWALDRDELRLVYQPILSLRDSQIVGVEALLRWQHPQRGMLEPSEFIELAKTSGLIVPIGDWAIGEACRQVAEWNRGRSDQPPLFVSVNLAPRQVRRDLIASVARSLRASGLEPRLLELEITEEVLLDKASRRVEVLRELKRLGVRIALDDYGTGYSSLTDLRRLTIDALKLDRSFVHGLGHDSEDAAIVSAALSMADALELGVTAEGVETLPQLARLRAGGCEYAQGYLFAPPAPASELEALLERGLAAGGVAA